MANRVTTFFLILIFIIMIQSVQAEDTSVLNSLSATKTAGYMIWTVMSGKDFISLRCLITKHPELGHQLRIFDFKKAKPILEFKPGDSFVGMYPTSDAGDLFTIWLGGSAYHFYMFSFQKNKVNLIFKNGSYMMPELINIEGNDKPAIIVVSQTSLDQNSIRQPTAATIYKWNGERYFEFKTIDWKDRFSALDK